MDAADDHGLIERYQAELRRPGYLADPAQARVAAMLDDLQQRLTAAPRRRRRRLAGMLKNPVAAPETGLYIWGDTGRGKTWLMDLFFDSLRLRHKLRRHFHRFMADIHDELAALGDRRDPLDRVAVRLAASARVICFDEFFVSDIADAMILGNLFEGLFRHGVTLVATSNTPPEDLYRDGLQRARFLPAIELIQRHTRTVELAAAQDYRLRSLARAEIYHCPLDPPAQDSLARSFEAVAPEVFWREGELSVLGRVIPTVRLADGVVWFDFHDICDGPRSQADYIEIARSFHTVLISGVPVFDPTLDNQARRFIALVDEFYDRNVKLIVSAAAPVANLYGGSRLAFEFRRTRSRMEEMQSHDYLARPHLP